MRPPAARLAWTKYTPPQPPPPPPRTTDHGTQRPEFLGDQGGGDQQGQIAYETYTD